MYTFLNKYGQALAFGIGVLVVILFLAPILTADATTLDQLQGDDRTYDTGIFDFGIWVSMILIGLAFLVAIVFGVGQIIDNPKGSLKGIAGLAVLVIIMLVGYSTASGESSDPEIVNAIQKFETSQEATLTAGNLKFISGSIITALVMLALAIVTLIGFGIRGIFK